MKEELKLIHRGSDELINEKELVEKLKIMPSNLKNRLFAKISKKE